MPLRRRPLEWSSKFSTTLSRLHYQDGCAQAAKDFNVDCIFVGPPEYNEAQEVQMLQDMIQRNVDGLAVSAANPKAMARALERAKEKGIPVVMFDSDVLPEDRGVRSTFIGTDNYSFGAELAKAVLATKKGGTVCIQSGAAASLNLNDRVQGIRDTLAGASKDQPVKRLTGQNGWTEPQGCPVYNDDDIRLAAQQVQRCVHVAAKLDAFIAVGGWAQYAPEAYRKAVDLQKDRVASKTSLSPSEITLSRKCRCSRPVSATSTLGSGRTTWHTRR